MTQIISISLGAILINNFIFAQFLGCCPFLGCSNKMDTAIGMGIAVVFVMGLASAICWVIDQFILVALGLEFLQTLAFILVIAALVQAADAVSAARPGARRENLENYIKRLEKLEEIASSFNGVEKCYAIQAGREIRILVKPEQVKDDDMPLIAREIVKRVESELEYPGTLKVHLTRESRAIDYAK